MKLDGLIAKLDAIDRNLQDHFLLENFIYIHTHTHINKMNQQQTHMEWFLPKTSCVGVGKLNWMDCVVPSIKSY